MLAKKSYSSEDIKILKELEAVRVRPGMYIGSTGAKGLHHILWEIIDNAVDEAANGFATTVDVKLHPDGSASVEDNGRGMPVDIHPDAGISGVEVIFTQLHAGGKFNNENYDYSGGLHGVGASVTNALSEWLQVEVYNKTVHKMEFHSYYDKAQDKVLSGVPKAPLVDTKIKTIKKGTFVRFKPDATVFETVEFNADTIINRLRETSFLNKGVELKFKDLRKGDNSQEYVFKSEGGIKDYVTYINAGKTVLYQEPLYFTDKKDDILIEISFQHTDGYSENVFSFVNNIPTIDGGTHDVGFKSGLTRFMGEYAKKVVTGKNKDIAFNGEDFRVGITAVITVKVKNAQFEGQTKGKLGNVEVRPAVESATIDALNEISKNKKLVKCFDAIIEKATSAAKEREAVRKTKELNRAKSGADSTRLLGKLAGCSSRDASLNEIFIVEGDSAGGSAKEGRDRKHQAILPLRGKPLNTEKKSTVEVLKNEEIKTIIAALGTGMGDDFNIDNLNYDKVIILSDADQDGYHIRCILLTFFYRYMPKLITEGHVYIGMPPLYKVYKKDVVEYAYDEAERVKKQEKVGRGYQIQRYKGLGEMNPEQLWDTTLNPENRLLMQVTIEEAASTERLITTLMGDAVDERKKYIQLHANFNKEDDFEVKVRGDE
ncbi:MAG: DNA gyrase subunit B [Clostridiales bacterium]|nr:DNA gyrase subunit B [Clostridiales bacterium]